MTNLNKLYFDIEGTTGSHLTCDVLSLSFINTSHNDKELETKTYYVRPRKSRIYQVDALMVNKFNPFDADKHEHSSFSFTKAINKKFTEIGNKGCFFVTWSGHSYDYMAISHHLFSNLFTWPWIFSTGQARQLDALPVAHNLDYYEPNKIATELNSKNNKVYKLESLCRMNGFPIGPEAHSSLADTKGLKAMVEHLQRKFPNLFKECLKNTDKQKILPSIKDKDVFIFPETFFAKTRNFAGTFVTEHQHYRGYYIVADLKHNWELIIKKKGQEFSDIILKAPKKIRQIKSNRNPLIQDSSVLNTLSDEYSEELKKIGLPELEKRANFIQKNREELAEKINLAIEDDLYKKNQDQSKKEFEEQIFDIRPSRDEKDMMQKFVEEKTSMDEQKKIIKSFKQPGLKYLGENILLDEYGQEAFDKKDYTKIRKRIAKRLLSTNTEKFPTIPEQFARVDALRVEMEQEGADKKKVEQVSTINKHLEEKAKENEKYL